MDPDSQSVNGDDELQVGVDDAGEPAAPAPAPTPRNVITMPTSAVAQIRREEREKGRKAMLAELDAEARSHGFRSYGEMKAAMVRGKQQPADDLDDLGDDLEEEKPRKRTARARQPVADKQQVKLLKQLEADNERLKADRRRVNRARARSDREARRLKREMDARDAEFDLRMAATRAGVKEVDYALHVLRQELRTKTSDELSSFDESKWFGESLRKSHPYLFEARSEPATTGTREGAQPPKPATQKPPVGEGVVDGTKMSRQEFLEHLKARGLKDPSSTF